MRVAGPLDDDWSFIVSDAGEIHFCIFETLDQLTLRDKDIYDGAVDRLWHPFIRLEGFTTGSGRLAGGGHALVFAYWSIVMSLTLLSAYLLFSKQRKATQNRITGPIAESST